MPRRPARRAIALFALSLALLAVVPCAALAGAESCCGAAAGCSDASAAPCAQLAATPCCEADSGALPATAAPQLPVLVGLAAPLALGEALSFVEPAPALRRTAPPALTAHLATRDTQLRL